jgi:hypothetical protein
VEKQLLEKLKSDPRTIRLRTNNTGQEGPPEVLAKTKGTGLFRGQPEYKDMHRTPAGAAASGMAPTGPLPPAQELVDKGNDFWFSAQWVVQVPEAVKPEAPAAKPETGAAPTP